MTVLIAIVRFGEERGRQSADPLSRGNQSFGDHLHGVLDGHQTPSNGRGLRVRQVQAEDHFSELQLHGTTAGLRDTGLLSGRSAPG